MLRCLILLAIAGLIQNSPVHPFTESPMSNPELFEGDIAGIDPKNASRSLYGTNINRWTNKQVPYVIDNVFSTAQLNTIYGGMRLIEARTCVRFIPRTTQTNYVRIRSLSGCYSYVGMIGGPQDVSIQAGGCTYNGIVAHELMHALGFWHEQSRPDRDNYVQVNYNNIQANMAYNFDKYTWSTTGASTPYDIYSIMHYESTAFSANGQATIVPLPPYQNVNLVNAAFKPDITNFDGAEINYFYQC